MAIVFSQVDENNRRLHRVQPCRLLHPALHFVDENLGNVCPAIGPGSYGGHFPDPSRVVGLVGYLVPWSSCVWRSGSSSNVQKQILTGHDNLLEDDGASRWPCGLYRTPFNNVATTLLGRRKHMRRDTPAVPGP